MERPRKRDTNAALAAAIVLVAEIFVLAAIIKYVPYTKIDWDAYMSQVEGFMEGERNYAELRGDTGPLVYPAGFLYSFSVIRFLTGGALFPAQLPWWALLLLSLSKRVHSIFVLRLFNDCVAVTLVHSAIALLLYKHWYLGLIMFSGAVSVKMNVLLYAPPLLLLMLKGMSTKGVILASFSAAAFQVLLGFPFLVAYPFEYILRSFNLGRVFIHFWSVNFKFVPESIFVSKAFAIALVVVHLLLLFFFARCKWCRHEGGILPAIGLKCDDSKCSTFLHKLFVKVWFDNSIPCNLDAEHITTVMFVGNFIGIICARSLHYQFYSWYFYSLPFLLWKAPFPTPLRLLLFFGVEICWNIYPSNAISSFILLLFHLIILWGLWRAPSEYPYARHEKTGKEV
ncbi:dol-P-Man:Man(5)GlcNAc(2)-PP-Dol alpha-1,3-mannosyltransferase isoform X2 [Cryptomeria japonica]|uniref:dol-P-Man:Man(5)GlcNAc(2)-PP-Dol alpha-1,3-mannosyltransferase isoform X2 n=1 Tax=Cryptomeria japonica TaxID=3369 RepID=UPI0027D9D940|nr:dol-P-Man:Man(5)GlcNAc(2)-PP-Dol alpha-1,3-mannosyltransferase isoform X2 [Cryptomeria japonica]